MLDSRGSGGVPATSDRSGAVCGRASMRLSLYFRSAEGPPAGVVDVTGMLL